MSGVDRYEEKEGGREGGSEGGNERASVLQTGREKRGAEEREKSYISSS